MKKPLAAASLLATWYLITPPYQQVGKFDIQAALSKWDKIAYYQSSAACESDRQSMIKTPGITPDYSKFLSATQCVADSDPRLKS
jgi:hypothetical protein